MQKALDGNESIYKGLKHFVDGKKNPREYKMGGSSQFLNRAEKKQGFMCLCLTDLQTNRERWRVLG